MNMIDKGHKIVLMAFVLFFLIGHYSLAAEYGKSRRINVNADSYLCAVDSIIANFDYATIFSDEFLKNNFQEEHANITKFMDEMGPFEMKISNNAKDSILIITCTEIFVPANRKIVRFSASNISRRDHALYSENYKYNFRLGDRICVTDAYNDVDFTKTRKIDKFLLPDNSFAQFEWFVTKHLVWILIVEGNNIEQIYVWYVISDGACSPIYDVLNSKFIVDDLAPTLISHIEDNENEDLVYIGLQCMSFPHEIEKNTRIDRNHVATAEGLQALAEQRVPEGKVFTLVEQMPQFPGGEAELMKFISDNLVYPEEAKKAGIQGRVVIQFVVLDDGSIGEVKVARGKSAELDKAAVEVVKNLPKFKPGLLNDRPVAVWYTLPVIFKLPQE